MTLLLAGCGDDTPSGPPADTVLTGDTDASGDVSPLDILDADGGVDVLPDAATGVDADTNWGPDLVFDPVSATTARDALDGTWTFRSNLPASKAACEAVTLLDADCTDADLDGLVDQWEGLAIAYLRPSLELDEQEPMLDEANAVVAQIARVFSASTDPLVVRLFIAIGYSRDYGTCFGASSHHGDPERVAIELIALDDGLGFRVARCYTAAHEHTAADHSALYAGDSGDLVFVDDPVTAEPRWRVFPSAGKHATYANGAICEAIAPGVPCFDEDCGANSVSNPVDFILLPPFLNAGEPDAPLEGPLDALGFPGDDAWLDQPFCGGLDRSGCSSALVEKLTSDPFN